MSASKVPQSLTPLSVTRHGLDTQRYWYHDPLLFVFNASRATDLIDLWNLRLEPHPVLPIPVEWFEALADDIHKLLKEQHRPVVGNPHGVSKAKSEAVSAVKIT